MRNNNIKYIFNAVKQMILEIIFIFIFVSYSSIDISQHYNNTRETYTWINGEDFYVYKKKKHNFEDN